VEARQSLVRFEGCLALSKLDIICYAFSAHVYRLSSLTSLRVALLDGGIDWSVQVFLDRLQCWGSLVSLCIEDHDLTETELKVASPILKTFSLYSTNGFRLQALRMHCPKLQQLSLLCRPSGHQDENKQSDLTGEEQCSDLQHITMSRKLFESLQKEWLKDLVSKGRNQALLRSGAIRLENP